MSGQPSRDISFWVGGESRSLVKDAALKRRADVPRGPPLPMISSSFSSTHISRIDPVSNGIPPLADKKTVAGWGTGLIAVLLSMLPFSVFC